MPTGKARYPLQGFTLIELIVTITIFAILAGIAIPSFQSIISQNRLRAITDDFVASLNLARSEAVSRNTTVAVCHSSNNTACTGDWGATWSDGWIVFVDTNNNDSVDGGEAVVAVYEGLPTSYSIKSNVASTALTFQADGTMRGEQSALRLCGPDADTNEAWSITLNNVGRPRLSKGSAACP